MAWAAAFGIPAGRAAQEVRIERDGKTVSFEATTASVKGPLEYGLSTGESGRSLLVTAATVRGLADALAEVGVKAKGTWVAVLVEWDEGGTRKKSRLQEMVVDSRTKRPLAADAFLLSGPAKNVLGLRQADREVLLQNPISDPPSDPSPYEARKEGNPPPGAKVTVTLSAAPGVRRVHARVKGRVQGVGFRDFTDRSAAALKVTGWVRNLADGDVELVAEGTAGALRALLEKVSEGPPSAKVSGVYILEARVATGEFKAFEVMY